MKDKAHSCIEESAIKLLISDAISNERYEGAIYKLRPHVRCFTDDHKYSLALLYDHHASRKKLLKARRLRFIASAEKIYRGILQRNPRHILSWLGLGRIEILRGNVAKALALDKKAYKLLTLQPRGMRGALGIGGLYEQTGRMKLAERWYLKERRLCGPNDFGTALNLFRFYMRNGPVEKAEAWAPRLKLLLNREFHKPQYRGEKMKTSKFAREIRRDLAAIHH